MSAILILGAAVWADGASPALRRRAVHAAEIWKARPHSWLIACGGLGNHPPAEAQVIHDILVAEGVDPEQIFQERHSTSTLENIRFALPIIRLLGTNDVTIVTEDYHAKRALMVARHFGLSALASCPDPTLSGLSEWASRKTRESAAQLVYRAKLRKIPKLD